MCRMFSTKHGTLLRMSIPRLISIREDPYHFGDRVKDFIQIPIYGTPQKNRFLDTFTQSQDQNPYCAVLCIVSEKHTSVEEGWALPL